MCNPFGGGDSAGDAAAERRRAEAERAARVREGTKSINQQFARFDDSFFSGINQDALDFFNPQVMSQFEDTQEGLIKNLARAGNLSGSVGARRLGELTEELGTEQARIADRARGITQGARGDIESSRSALIQNLAATADPFAAANASAAQAKALTQTPQFEPVGDLFTKFLNLASPQIVAAGRGFQNPASMLFGGGGGSSTVVT